MPALANLLLRRQKLIDRLKTKLAADERIDVERQLNQICNALDLLEALDPNLPH